MHHTATMISIIVSAAVVLIGLMPPRLQLAKWREDRFAPCTFGRFLRIVLFAGLFGVGAGAWQLLIDDRGCDWCGRVLSWPVVGALVAGVGAGCYLFLYAYELWVLDAIELERKDLKAAASR